jgi:ABC-type antimicrobial peptide transport system permease subunit
VLVVGVLVGLGIAVAATRLLESLLFGVEPAYVSTFLGMSAALVAVRLLASYLPARRASSVDPIESLRGD